MQQERGPRKEASFIPFYNSINRGATVWMDKWLYNSEDYRVAKETSSVGLPMNIGINVAVFALACKEVSLGLGLKDYLKELSTLNSLGIHSSIISAVLSLDSTGDIILHEQLMKKIIKPIFSEADISSEDVEIGMNLVWRAARKQERESPKDSIVKLVILPIDSSDLSPEPNPSKESPKLRLVTRL